MEYQMMNRIIYIMIALLGLHYAGHAQRIRNVHFEQEGKKVIIYYDLEGKKNYQVSIFCSTDGGSSWGEPLRAVTGDVGQNQKPGRNRKIIWDVLAEREKLEGEIMFKIKAVEALKTYKSSFMAVAIPGARLKHYPGGESRGGIRAVLFYGCMAGSLGCKIASDNYYDKYHKAVTQEDMDKYYTSANNYWGMTTTLFFIGVAAWGFDMLYYGLQGFKPVQHHVSLSYDPALRAAGLSYVYKF
jgi:hypothetical protein